MKKLFTGIVAFALCLAIVAPERQADAQVVVTNRCCDTANVIRCFTPTVAPLGTPCFCYGQGNGHSC